MNQVKLLAAGLLAACGLGLTAGSGWLSTAGAQSDPRGDKPYYVPPGMPPSPAERVKQLEAELAKARADVADADKLVELTTYRQAVEALNAATSPRAGVKIADDATNTTRNNDYLFVAVREMAQREFMQFLQTHEDKGWIFSGTAPMDDPKLLVWVFRRPKAEAKAATADSTLRNFYGRFGDTTPVNPAGGQLLHRYTTNDPTAKPGEKADPKPVSPPSKPADPRFTKPLSNQDDEAAIKAEIMRLQNRLTEMKKNPPPTPQRKELGGGWTRFAQADLPLPVADVADLLRKLGEKKFGPTKIEVQVSGDKVIVFGGQEVGEWAAGVVKTLSGK